MFDKLKSLEQKYIELEAKLSGGDIFNDPKLAAALMKERKSLGPVVEAYRRYLAAERAARESEELLQGEADADFRELAREELGAARRDMERLTSELRLLLLPRDENDDRGVIMEIRGGAGGEEAALFAAALYRAYCMYAAMKGFKAEVLSANMTELGGVKEISFSIEGEGAYSRFKYESGVHRVQRVPETESSGRIHTSTVTVAVLPEAEEVEVDINPADLAIDTYRSGGAGGQHVNKTESAIRITHLPSGLVVECQDERSQHKNRDRAMKILRSRLLERETAQQASRISAERRSQVGTGDRSERIRTYNYPQGRVTDHRVGLTLHRLDAVLSGDFDEIFDALGAAAQAELLAGSDIDNA